MSKKSVDGYSGCNEDDGNLDDILTEIGGFGKFQIITYLLICIPNIISAATYVNYMITSTPLSEFRFVLTYNCELSIFKLCFCFRVFVFI